MTDTRHSVFQKSPQFFKVIPSTQNSLPSIQNYQQLSNILKNHSYLYLDFNQKDQNSLFLLEKTQTPTKNLPDDHDQYDHHELPEKQIQSLGNQYILGMNNLSRPSYKMVRYVSQSKRLMNKKKSIDQLENDFVLNFGKDFNNRLNQTTERVRLGSVYRKVQEKNRKLQYSSKIAPQVKHFVTKKLEEYLQSKEYRKVQRKLQKSEKQLQKYVLSLKELKQREKEGSLQQKLDRMKGRVSEQDMGQKDSGKLSKKNGLMEFMRQRRRSSTSLQLQNKMINKRNERSRFPKLRELNQLFESTKIKRRH